MHNFKNEVNVIYLDKNDNHIIAVKNRQIEKMNDGNKNHRANETPEKSKQRLEKMRQYNKEGATHSSEEMETKIYNIIDNEINHAMRNISEMSDYELPPKKRSYATKEPYTKISDAQIDNIINNEISI